MSDVRHFSNLPDDAPGPARRMADQWGSALRAATPDVGRGAGPVREHVGLRGPIEWRCTPCDDDGVASGWEDSTP